VKLAKNGKNNYNFSIDFHNSSRYFLGQICAWLGHPKHKKIAPQRELPLIVDAPPYYPSARNRVIHTRLDSAEKPIPSYRYTYGQLQYTDIIRWLDSSSLVYDATH